MTAEQAQVRCTEQEAQANLLAVLQLCAAGKLRCSPKTHRPGAATVTAVAEILHDGDFYPADPMAAFAWPLLLQAGGLAELSSGKLVLTARGRAALSKPPQGTLKLLWQRWLTRGLLDEFSRIEEIKGQRAAAVLSAAGPRRKTVGQALAACAPSVPTSANAISPSPPANSPRPEKPSSPRAIPWAESAGSARWPHRGRSGPRRKRLPCPGRATPPCCRALHVPGRRGPA